MPYVTWYIQHTKVGFQLDDLVIPAVVGIAALFVAHLINFTWNFVRSGDRIALDDERAARKAVETERDNAEAALQKAGVSDVSPITPKNQLRLGLISVSGAFGDGTTEGWPSNLGMIRHIQLSLLFNPDGDMDLERVSIQVAGKSYEATGWVILPVGAINGCTAYFPVDGVPSGSHHVRIEGFAEGQWWRSPKAYSIWFP